MATLLLTDISQLLTIEGPDVLSSTADSDASATAAAERSLGIVPDACVVVCDGRVLYAGPRATAPSPASLPGPITEASAGGRLVTPGLIDPHTHLIWAGDRSLEFDLRNRGVPYQEIQARGGGILSTVSATTQASDQTLSTTLRSRLDDALRQGVTLCEVKTGYGLFPNAELRLLRLIQHAAQGHSVAVSPTFLCHVPPPSLGPLADTSDERQRFVLSLCDAISSAQAQGADAVDVYCDAGAFTLAEAGKILATGKRAGLHIHCHAEQFTYTGVAEHAASLGARSVEHIEEIDDAGVAALARNGVVANLLPGAVVTLRLRWPDARRLIRAGVRVALGSDCNPGSSYTQSQALMMSLACTQMGLSAAEAWLGVTRHAAHALGVQDAGRLRPGARGDLVVWNVEHYREVCQRLGASLVHRVYPARAAQAALQ